MIIMKQFIIIKIKIYINELKIDNKETFIMKKRSVSIINKKDKFFYFLILKISLKQIIFYLIIKINILFI